MQEQISFKPPASSRPGVFLEEAEFSFEGVRSVPFQGGKFTVEPGRTSKPDTHTVAECWMVAKGEGVLTYDGSEIRVSAGEFVYFEPMKTHQVSNEGDELLVIYTVWWDS